MALRNSTSASRPESGGMGYVFCIETSEAEGEAPETANGRPGSRANSMNVQIRRQLVRPNLGMGSSRRRLRIRFT
ncbi:hypothetical protein KM92DES2_12410 [uncultured Desulfovibrio sp.]|uniref:Uncharacterized protein n=1 Tax=uncultured Desulfovibrio sp. TaxID=167968 RepID=A0A212K8E8_9BACT|nr:hypothetical protein KM92DES2_12410 [uncultured Desulfovibrio sp.]